METYWKHTGLFNRNPVNVMTAVSYRLRGRCLLTLQEVIRQFQALTCFLKIAEGLHL